VSETTVIRPALSNSGFKNFLKTTEITHFSPLLPLTLFRPALESYIDSKQGLTLCGNLI
jgi:hypothetical protein